MFWPKHVWPKSLSADFVSDRRKMFGRKNFSQFFFGQQISTEQFSADFFSAETFSTENVSAGKFSDEKCSTNVRTKKSSAVHARLRIREATFRGKVRGGREAPPRRSICRTMIREIPLACVIRMIRVPFAKILCAPCVTCIICEHCGKCCQYYL